MNRHLREGHPSKRRGATCKKLRQNKQRDRAALCRALKRPAQSLEARGGGETLGGGEARGGGGGGATPYMMYVTSPPHREGFYEGLLGRFAEAGFAISNIRRRKGMDFAVYAARAAKAKPAARAAKQAHVSRRKFGTALPPAGLAQSQFLHWDFLANFLPTAKREFGKNPA